MKLPAFLKPPWLPLTPAGVAAFASARLGRLLLVQLIFALAAAGVIGWFFSIAWAPAIEDAIAHLPDSSRISDGGLQWTGKSPGVLASHGFLAFTVDLDHSSEAVSTAVVQIELGRRNWRVSVLLGELHWPWVLQASYPDGYLIGLNHAELGPWWGARRPFLLVLIVAGTVLYLMLSWAVLATVYWVPAWLVGFYANRKVTWSGSWRLAGAALMPGALLLTVAIALYGLRVFDLLKLAFAFGIHFIVGWVFVFFSPFFLPRLGGSSTGRNPFKNSH